MAAETTQDILFRIVGDAAIFIETVQQMMGGMDDLDKGMQKVEKNTSFLNQTLSTFVANIGVKVVGAIQQAVGKLGQLFGQFIEFAKGATMSAARIEVQWRTLSLTAGNAGKRIEDMTKHIQALRAAGIKTGEALEIVTQFLANQLPVENIKELARRAQDLAVVIGTDSTEAFQRFNNFLQTGNSEWIRTMGITKTANQMLTEYAQTQGKVVKALTDRERKEALVQGLMKETLRYEGAYEEAMRDPYKRWTSLPRLISNVTEVLGAVFVPMMGTVVDVFSDALEKIERLFRVTKKEAKETGATIGEWKEGFLKLRAVVTAFANWFMSIWKRLTGGFNEQSEGMMDRFVNAIVRGVKAAAAALRRFAQFVAGIFGGRAPGEPTAEAIARTKPEAKAAPPKRVAPAAGPPVEVPVTPGAAAKVRAKPVAPPAAEDLKQMSILTGAWAEATKRLAQASAAAAKARTAMAKAEKWLEKASEKVYDIRRKIQRLELDWAEIPERFIRGRKRQLQIELQAAQHEEHERKKVVEAERERLKLAEEIERQAQKAADNVKRQMDKVADSIARQAEKYEQWLGKLQQAEQIRLEEPIQAIVNEFESLDDLTAGYLEEIEGELMPAFASIEESVKSIVDSFKTAIGQAREWGETIWGKLQEIRQWFDDLPDWAKKILMGGAIALGISWLTGAGGLGGLTGGLTTALKAVGLALGPAGWALAISATILATMIIKNKEELARWFDPQIEPEKSRVAQAATVGAWWLYEKLPKGDVKNWWDKNILSPLADVMTGSEQAVTDSVTKGVYDPTMREFNKLSDDLVGFSVVPEMVQEVVGWFEKMILDLTPFLDRLTSKFNVLTSAIKGIPPVPRDLIAFDAGQLKIITVNLQGSQFGAGVNEWEVKDWMHEALDDVMRD